MKGQVGSGDSMILRAGDGENRGTRKMRREVYKRNLLMDVLKVHKHLNVEILGIQLDFGDRAFI